MKNCKLATSITADEKTPGQCQVLVLHLNPPTHERVEPAVDTNAYLTGAVILCKKEKNS